jgi:hypothetical protein
MRWMAEDLGLAAMGEGLREGRRRSRFHCCSSFTAIIHSLPVPIQLVLYQ